MRFMIFIFFLSLPFISKASEFCGSNEGISLIYKGDKVILKCDCNCTNEENRFYINSKTIVEASRLISLDGISKIVFDKFKDNKKYADGKNISNHIKII